jgi:hypothetical protein
MDNTDIPENPFLDDYPEWLQAPREIRLEIIHKSAREQGIKYALNTSLEVSNYFDMPTPTVFGSHWFSHFTRHKNWLCDVFGKVAPELVEPSIRTFLYANKYNSVLEQGLSLITIDNQPTNPHEIMYSKSDRLSIKPRLALVLFCRVPSERDPLEELFNDTYFLTPEIGCWVLYCMGLVWFFEAAALYSTNPPEAHNMLFEASQALEHADSLNNSHCETTITKSASELAKRRHAENYALADEVRTYWRQNIDPSLSAQKAADEIVRCNLVSLSHKKIAEIISALRKTEVMRTK